MMRAWFHAAFLRFAIDGHQPEFRAVAEDPLEIVEQRPVDVAAYIDSVRDAARQARQRAIDIFDAARVILRAHTVFRNIDGNTDTLAGIPYAGLQSLRPE